MHAYLFFLLLATAAVGCLGGPAPLPAIAPGPEGRAQAPEAAEPEAKPGPPPEPEDTTPPGEGAQAPLRWEMDYRVGLLVVACVADACPGYAEDVSEPGFRPQRDERDPRVAAAEGYVLAAHWNATTEAARRLTLRVVDHETGDVVAEASGASPLLLEAPKERLEDGRAYTFRVRPESVGVMRDQTVHFVLDLR